jgi:hypothetical protein
MLEDGPSTCERCGGQLRRVFHPTGIIFRGSGFYKNDSRAGDAAPAAASSGGKAKPADGATSPSGTSKDSGAGKSGEPGPSAGKPAASESG